MTNNQHGQVPAIQRYKIGYHSDEWGVRSSTPSGIKDQAGPWVRYEDHVAELRRLHAYCQELEAQVIRDCMTHVQNPAENEHVAGDVSKNGAELNTSTQQPAPAGATQDDGIAARRAKYLRNDTDAGRAYVAQYLRSMGQHYFDDYIQTDLAGDFACALAASLSLSAPQPSPTAQAASSTVLKAIREANMQLVRTGDNAFMLVPYKVATAQAAGSVPAVLGDDELVRLGKSPESGLPPWGIGTTRADYLRAVRAVLAAARAPADSVLGDAARLKARHDFLLWNRSLQPSPIESSVEYSVFDKALELYDAARAPAESVLEDALNRLLEAATEIVETVECYDPDTLLALDEDPHPPSTINASSDNLKHAIVSIRAAMAANGGNK